MRVHRKNGEVFDLDECTVLTRIDTDKYTIALIETPTNLCLGDIVDVHFMSFSVIKAYDRFYECIQIRSAQDLAPTKPSGVNSLRDISYNELFKNSPREEQLSKDELEYFALEWPYVYQQYTEGGWAGVKAMNPGSHAMILQDIRDRSGV